MVRRPTSKKDPLVGAVREERRWGGTVRCPRCKKESRYPAERCGHCGYSFRETQAFGPSLNDSPEDLIGRVINDKYRVVSILGEGGFGVVYKVELLLFDTCNTFALKLLHPALSQDSKFRRRFLREAALAMQLIHENTIQIREFGRTEDGNLFFTMDYCEGEPLNQVIAREGFLTVNRAIYITGQVLSVMQMAHSRGIIHRDLKPENVFLERDRGRRDFVKVGDFGLAKSYLAAGESGGAEVSGITQGAILGTPRYMSPEQARGREDLDDRSDLYSIGVMLYEMLYGEVSEDLHDATSLRPPEHRGHVVPQAVWQVVHRALARRRQDRFQSAEDFSRALNALPQYTPGYIEPETSGKESGRLWWRWSAACLVVALPLALLVSLAQDGFSGLFLSGEDSGQSPYPSSHVDAYLPCQEGSEFVYGVSIEQGPETEITYRILRQTHPGVFEVEVLPEGRIVFWVIDRTENCFSLQFFPPAAGEPDGGSSEPRKRIRRDLLRLPPGDTLREDFVSQGFREFKVRKDLVDLEGRYTRCLLVEAEEGEQRRLQYYKQGVGLVGLEVYEIEDSAEGATTERLVYARYLKRHSL